MNVLPVTKEMKVKIRAKANIDEQTLMEAVKILKEWLELQPHLPHDYDEARLESLYLKCKSSIEKCKQTIDMYYTLKSALPEIFCNRDPNEPWFKQATSYGCIVPLPEMTDDYERVIILIYLNQDPSKYNIYDQLKMTFMLNDLRTIEDYGLGDIYIVDSANTTVGDAVKYTLPVMKKIQVILFVHVHKKGSCDLLKIIPPRILPKEYGGDGDSLLDHWDNWKKKMESYRDWFLEQENKNVDESKRPDKSFNANELFGFEGSFRQLNVD